MVRKNWLVRVNPCQAKLQKVACPSKALADYFVKVRSWEWSFVRLPYESHIVKVKSCQFDLWILYCISVVLSGKMFRMKPYFWLNSIHAIFLLYKSKPSQLVYSLRRWRFYLLPLPLRDAVWKVSNAPFLPPWPSHTWVRSSYRRTTHEYFSVRPYPAWHVGYISL